jgi:RNA polymerase-binding transcription factor DksA
MNDQERPDLHASSSTGTGLAPGEHDAMRQSLIDERDAVRAQIDELTKNFDDIVAAVEDTNNDDEHDPEGTTIAFERAQAAALLNQAKADLEAIDASLGRLDDGTYGTCEACGEPIGVERHHAIPSASKCVDCA